MRTTITLDPDVERLLKEAMHDDEASFKQVVNDAIRRGLQRVPAARRSPFRQPVFDTGRALVDLTKANALAGELEDLDLIARLQPAGLPGRC